MSKKQFKSQASSGRAAFGGGFGGSSFGSTAFGSHSSPLSYVYEAPDLTGLSDANVVVTFKNLMKKDSTTKAKALEDLQQHVSSPDVSIEEALLAAWVKLFPRLSIDTSRRVRQLSHVNNGHIATKCGKRTIPHMPQIVSPWLAGTHDNDRSAAKAAQDALKQTFNTSDKLSNVPRVFQKDILEYCRDVVQNETRQTLSDERSVNKDDAEATYSRVIATCLAVVSNLISDLPLEEQDKQHDTYAELLSDEKLWSFVSYQDVAVRRAALRLLRNALDKKRDVIQQSLGALSSAIVGKALHADQVGSATELIATTSELTRAFPSIWTSDYTGKKSAEHRLRQCIKRGSQSSPQDYWSNLWKLFSRLPVEVLPKESQGAKDLIKSLHDGVSLRDERFNASSAWETYFKVLNLVCQQLPEAEQDSLVEAFALPVIEQYLRPSEAGSHWSLAGAKPAWNVSKAAYCKRLPAILEKKWPDYTNQLIEEIKTSLPEQSKAFDHSQTGVASAAERWSQLQGEILKGDSATADTLRTTFVQAADLVVKESLALLKTRNGKPYGAAAVIDGLVTNFGNTILTNQETHDLIITFLKDDASGFLLSKSQPQIFSLLYHLHEDSDFRNLWTAFAHALAAAPESLERTSAFRNLLASPRVKPAIEIARSDTKVQEFLQSECRCLLVEEHDWSFISNILKHNADVLSPATRDQIMADMLSSLSVSGQSKSALQGLDNITKNNRPLMDEFMAKPEGSQVLPKLLLLEDSPDDEIAQKASDLSKQLVKSSGTGKVPSASFDVVQQGLTEASPSSLPIHTIVDMASRLLEQSGAEAITSLLPNVSTWAVSMKTLLSRPPAPSVSLMSPLGGSIFLSEPPSQPPAKISRDGDGYTQPLRFGLFVARLLSDSKLFDKVSDEAKTEILVLLNLTVLLANDNLSVRKSNALWAVDTPDVEAEMLEFVSQAQLLVKGYLEAEAADKSIMSKVVGTCLERSQGLGSAAFYYARVFATLQSELLEVHGCSTSESQKYAEMVQKYKKSKDSFELPAILGAFHQTLWSNGSLHRFCNELVADLTGAKVETQPKETFEKLVNLNILVQGQEIADGTIAKQRLIFFVKHVIPWLNEDKIPAPLKAEVFKALAALLPGMGDMYGEHWGQLLDTILSTWTATSLSEQSIAESDLSLVLLHSSLRLFATLRSLKTIDDPNDDLLDVWKEKESALAKTLIDLLAQNQDVPDDAHQPLKITNDLIAREIGKLPKIDLEEASRLYPLLYAPSQSIQQTAFNLLHHEIPAAQEQISFDAALENKAARLPEELLSLILEAPTLDAIAEAPFERSIPIDLKGYMYSWILIFDHFTNSSYKVKTDYIENLKDGDCVSPLLNFTYDFLGHSNGKPIDVSKFDIVSYNPDTEDSPEKETQYLLTHLYFLSLTHIPSLTKAHYLTLNSRQTSLAVSSWTSKYISPLIISHSLSSVSDWSTTTSSDPEYENFSVKVASRSKEVNVSFLVDEQTMAIVVRLPDEYPLQGARVEGISRVAVDEKRWQSWLRNCQGVITFSNGNLIDGISSWRKNVNGALKGQTECAICYSIISSDKQLPSKRCGTCKNLFHSGCLFKWFKSSNASSCPLCRNAFNYG